MNHSTNEPLDLVTRRRAAYKILSEVLEGDILLQAMWMIEERDQNAERLTFLDVVEATAETFGIDNKVISSLYIKFNQFLIVSNHQLPPDPLEMMIKQRDIKTNEVISYSPRTSSIFRSNDIFGIVEKQLSSDAIHQVGQALASEAKQKNCSYMIIARDDRESSLGLSKALAQGILSTGLNVIDLENAPLPLLNFVTHHFEGRAGVMVSGGHHSSEYNSLKMLAAGELLEGKSIQKIKQRIENLDFDIADETGSLEHNTSYAEEYIGMISEDIKLTKPLTIIIDGKLGCVTKLATDIFQALGCKVVCLDKEINENLADLVYAVVNNKADLGIAFDSEGSRIRVVDSTGNLIAQDQLIKLIVQDILKSYPATQIIHDTQDTSALADFIRQNSGLPIVWKKGAAFMKKQLKQTASKFAGDMHGHLYFYDRWYGFDDALYAAVRIIELISKSSQLSEEVFATFPKASNTMDLKLKLPPGENHKLVENLIKQADFKENEAIDTDGLRVDFEYGWMLIRADSSSSSVVFHFEAETDEKIISMQNTLKQLLKKISPELHMPF